MPKRRMQGRQQRRRDLCALAIGVVVLGAVREIAAQESTAPRVLEFRFTPVHNAQIALWLEDFAGKFLATAGLTLAVARRGIGNRPGASQMNSGFRWPYGRREGVLPVWAHRRMTGDGAQPFRRVIFQKRKTEGLASKTSNDGSKDDYFCLAYDRANSRKDALDAVSCASVFNSDKGRFMTDADVASGYAEPYEDPITHRGRLQPLTAASLYPPRRDARPCQGGECFDHADLAEYDAHARTVMPDIDAVSMATPQGDQPAQVQFTIPQSWPLGGYRACLEINVEGDYNDTYNDHTLRTPQTPTASWDNWAKNFGYPYRGQPSVVYCVPFQLSDEIVVSNSTSTAEGSVASWDTTSANFGTLQGMDGMSDDWARAPGSGADRLKMVDGARLTVAVRPPISCEGNTPPGPVGDLTLRDFANRLQAHQWAELSFSAAAEDSGVFRYEARVSTEPIVDELSFMRGEPAKNATLQADELRIPTGAASSTRVQAELGGLVAETHYYLGVRPIDACAAAGPIRVAEFTTLEREFATVSPCFVATAAYGTPLADEISALRRLRDRHLANNVLGRLFLDAYASIGPKLAEVIRAHETLRALSRALLAPLVAAARNLDD